MTYDAVIIGGGIVGSACAYRLSSEGLKVALVEEKFVAAGVTAAGMGHIVVMDDSEAQFALTSLSRDIWREISNEIPKKCEFENCGTIWVASDDQEMAAAEKKRDFYVEHGASAKVIGTKELYKLEPNLAEGLTGGLLVEEDCVVYQLSAASFFVELATQKGAEVITGERASSIIGTQVLLENGKALDARTIVNAAGLSAPRLTPELEINPKKGHLVITDRYSGFVTRQLVELGYLKSAHGSDDESVAFNIQPRITGQVLIGSSRQPGVASREIDRDIVAKMLRRAFRFMPSLKNLSVIRTWTGIRPSTRDNLPYIGRSLDNKNVIVAAGHEGLGITTATGTAELVADEIFARKSRISRTPYSPARIQAQI